MTWAVSPLLQPGPLNWGWDAPPAPEPPPSPAPAIFAADDAMWNDWILTKIAQPVPE